MLRAACRRARRTSVGTSAACCRISSGDTSSGAVHAVELPREAAERAVAARRARGPRWRARGARRRRPAADRGRGCGGRPPDRSRTQCASHHDRRGRASDGSSQHDLVEGIFDDPLGARGLEPRNQVADRPLLDDRIHRHPLVVAQRRDGRPLERRAAARGRRRDPRAARSASGRRGPARRSAAFSSSARFSIFVRFQASVERRRCSR